MNGNKEEFMTVDRFCNNKAVCIAFGDNCICFGNFFDDGSFGVTFCFYWMRRTVVWKVKANGD